ncbi:hypothetical protein M8J76_004406 [Diaphorina citri]|nr:hypothetical protein M8J75_013165 [Diaphorina citri]KAI5729192.1 hypothetical protein M8J76_000052 [Diaphorina citri]KAI5729598.1 hypothetical protein M8J76_004406 [Diaphorina citri]
MKKYPNLNVNEGNLADRKYQIVKKKYVNELTLDKIRREVGNIIHAHENYQSNENESMTVDNVQCDGTPDDTIENNQNVEPNITFTIPTHEMVYIDQMRPMFEYNIETYSNTLPEYRPKIPCLPRRLNKKHYQYLNVANELISQRMMEATHKTLPYLLFIVYCAAITVIQNCGIKITEGNPSRRSEPRNRSNEPTWKINITKRIKLLRKDIGKLTSFMQGNRRWGFIKYEIKPILRRYHIRYNDRSLENNKKKPT